jgi:5-methylcytosine-specific restriction endonuclease McrA
MAVDDCNLNLHIIKRSVAIKIGLVRYFTGKPCPHGHITNRITKEGSCVECVAIKAKSNSKKEYDRNRYINNSDAIKEKRLNSYYLNKNKENSYTKFYARNNPDKIRIIKSNYKFKRRALEKTGASTKELKIWLSKQHKICYWCNKKCDDDFHIDHYLPLSKGGLHKIENLVISCPTCNLTKSAKDPYEYALTVGRLF